MPNPTQRRYPHFYLMAKKPDTSSRIADNKKAAFNYFFEERFEAGIVLEGWEVKSLREGKV